MRFPTFFGAIVIVICLGAILWINISTMPCISGPVAPTVTVGKAPEQWESILGIPETPVDPHLRYCDMHQVRITIVPPTENETVIIGDRTYRTASDGTIIAGLCPFEKYNISFGNRSLVLYPAGSEYWIPR